jgi:hypothetical protein
VEAVAAILGRAGVIAGEYATRAHDRSRRVDDPSNSSASGGASEGIDALLAPRSRAELALRRRAVWSEAGERAACEMLGRWNGEFKRLVHASDQAALGGDANTNTCLSEGGAVCEGVDAAMARGRDEFTATRAAEAATAAARAAEAAAKAASAVAQAAKAAQVTAASESTPVPEGRNRRPEPRRSHIEYEGEIGWREAWRADGEDRTDAEGTHHQGQGPTAFARSPLQQAQTSAYVAEVIRPHGAKRTASPPSWQPPHVSTCEQPGPPLCNNASAYTCAGARRFTAGGETLRPAAAAAAAAAASTAAGLAATAAAKARPNFLQAAATSSPTGPQRRTMQQSRPKEAPPIPPPSSSVHPVRRRRWFKVVAVVSSKRGGQQSHRFVDIVNGVSEFHFGRTTTRYDGSLLVGPPVPAHGFEVHESVRAAISTPFPAEARHIHAPRALLEVMVGGQPQTADGKIYFVQLTPTRLLADPERYAVLHKELFGDEYYLPAPPLTLVDTVAKGAPAAAAAAAEAAEEATARLTREWTAAGVSPTDAALGASAALSKAVLVLSHSGITGSPHLKAPPRATATDEAMIESCESAHESQSAAIAAPAQSP